MLAHFWTHYHPGQVPVWSRTHKNCPNCFGELDTDVAAWFVWRLQRADKSQAHDSWNEFKSISPGPWLINLFVFGDNCVLIGCFFGSCPRLFINRLLLIILIVGAIRNSEIPPRYETVIGYVCGARKGTCLFVRDSSKPINKELAPSCPPSSTPVNWNPSANCPCFWAQVLQEVSVFGRPISSQLFHSHNVIYRFFDGHGKCSRALSTFAKVPNLRRNWPLWGISFGLKQTGTIRDKASVILRSLVCLGCAFTYFIAWANLAQPICLIFWSCRTTKIHVCNISQMPPPCSLEISRQKSQSVE